MKVAAAIWLAVAQLHRSHPEASDFSVREIVDEALRMFPEMGFRPGLQAHVSAHCVATKRPDPARFRMLTATGRGRRRLFRFGDACHPFRATGALHPEPRDVPPQWLDLLDWYKREYGPEETRAPSARQQVLTFHSGDLFRASPACEAMLQEQQQDPSLPGRRREALRQLAEIRPLPLSPDDLVWLAEDPDIPFNS